jgi:AraC family transcriptional activator of mtrCDE
MPQSTDWLSRLLEMIPVTGRVDYRCFFAAPWRLEFEAARTGEIPYHIVLRGSVSIEEAGSASTHRLNGGDIVLLPQGNAHVLQDGSGARPSPSRNRPGPAVTISENDGTGEQLEMLCGRFIVSLPHERLLRRYLPSRLIISAAESGAQLTGLVALMRAEAAAQDLGGRAMLNALSTAVFALTLRLASASAQTPAGLLALAGHPRLAPALAAIFDEPARPWSVPLLAALCNMSRATFVRQFQEKLGSSASEMLADIRMTLAANEIRHSSASTGAIAESVGYRSEAAFQRAFKHHMGITPAQWRRQAQSPQPVTAPGENRDVTDRIV